MRELGPRVQSAFYSRPHALRLWLGSWVRLGNSVSLRNLGYALRPCGLTKLSCVRLEYDYLVVGLYCAENWWSARRGQD